MGIWPALLKNGIIVHGKRSGISIAFCRIMTCLSQKQLFSYAHWRGDVRRIFLDQPTWLITRHIRIPLGGGDARFIYSGGKVRVVEFNGSAFEVSTISFFMWLKFHLASLSWYNKFSKFHTFYPISNLLRLLEKDFTPRNMGCADV